MQMCVSQNASHVRPLLFADGEVQQLIPFPGQLPAPAHFIVVANGCSRCVAFLFVLSVFRTDYSCGVYCVYAYISMCVRVRPKSISSPAKHDFLHVYLCVSFLSAQSAANSRVGTRQHLSPSVLKSFNFLPWFACAKAGNTSADERIWIYLYCSCVDADICSHLFHFHVLRVDWRKLRLIYIMILQISCYVYEQILRDGVSKNDKNWCAAAFFWKYRCLYCCSLHIIWCTIKLRKMVTFGVFLQSKSFFCGDT
jgi:hypothetical protein